MDLLTIDQIFQYYRAIPNYQRDYEWSNAENGTLLCDIMQILENSGHTQNPEDYFLGAIVSIPYKPENASREAVNLSECNIMSYNKIRHIVDGQQRLTSLSIFIKALLQSIYDEKNLSDDYKDSNGSVLKDILFGTSYHRKTKRKVPHLILSGNTGKCYNNIILGFSDENYDARLKSAKKIINAKKSFITEIESYKKYFLGKSETKPQIIFSDESKFYDELLNVLTTKICFAEIYCEDKFNAFQVFDSLNGKGFDLTAADRIKNIFISWAGDDGSLRWEGLTTKIGANYLSNFFICLIFWNKGQRLSQNKLPDSFRDEYKPLATHDFNSFYNDLLDKATLYGCLRISNIDDTDIKEKLQDIQSLRLDQIYVIIFAVSLHYGYEKEQKKSYLKFLDTVTSLIVRMQVCEKSMNKLDAYFKEWISLIQKTSGSISLDDLNKQIRKQTLEIAPDKAFEDAFVQFAPEESPKAEYYLRKLELHRRKEAKDQNPVDRGLTIEHIIPQSIKSLADLYTWYGEEKIPDYIKDDIKSIRENIGNKALLNAGDNSSASNNYYEKKTEVYLKGKKGDNSGSPAVTFKLVSDLIKDFPEKFTHTEVTSRAKKLAAIAVKIW